MKYDAAKSLDLIPRDLLATIELANISFRCRCDRVHYMPTLTTEEMCACGRKIAFSKRMQAHYMTGDPAVRRQVKAILKRIQVS